MNLEQLISIITNILLSKTNWTQKLHLLTGFMIEVYFASKEWNVRSKCFSSLGNNIIFSLRNIQLAKKHIYLRMYYEHLWLKLIVQTKIFVFVFIRCNIWHYFISLNPTLQSQETLLRHTYLKTTLKVICVTFQDYNSFKIETLCNFRQIIQKYWF